MYFDYINFSYDIDEYISISHLQLEEFSSINYSSQDQTSIFLATVLDNGDDYNAQINSTLTKLNTQMVNKSSAGYSKSMYWPGWSQFNAEFTREDCRVVARAFRSSAGGFEEGFKLKTITLRTNSECVNEDGIYRRSNFAVSDLRIISIVRELQSRVN